MKIRTLAILIFAAALHGCGFKEKEQQIARKEKQLAEKEQSLIQWEQRLTLLERDLLDKKKKQAEDSTAAMDSTQAQIFVGKWTIKMRCVETNCSGSAIGDSKTETWEISYQNRAMVVNAFARNELSRIYNGSFSQNRLEVANGQPGAESLIRVILEAKENKMEGIRDVERADCKIRYTLTAERQKQS
jgi:hypothetical protein